ncbi:hypothetical protein NQ315_009718 [Exocentrus adspersus]|uniref:Rap-GAP domain-containing protein n=1 Tax=Exocentrus adspersus TaxID=1586481 RepID=A0AAV8WHZ1_9CUCU|nr:hypothetical protein NQ315_009718 [Exocentrus adspersus]
MSDFLTTPKRMAKGLPNLYDKTKSDARERKRNILYLILNYLTENGFHAAVEVLQNEADLTSQYQACENVDLDIILQEYQSYYYTKFQKYPKLVRRISESADNSKGDNNKSKMRSSAKKVRSSECTGQKEKQVENQAFHFDILPLANNDIQMNSQQQVDFKEKLAYRFENHSSEWQELADEITKDIIPGNSSIKWNDCIGLTDIIEKLKEATVYPVMYPELFENLPPWKGILLYGPPGTGKTLLAKALASEGCTTFINVTSSTFVSKWRGESEKMLKTLFEMAKASAPATIFIDELDSLVSANALSYHEATRRFKSELLVQIDGVSSHESKVLIMGSTNHPWNLDAAMLRRFEKRILVELPSEESRKELLMHYLKQPYAIRKEEFQNLAEKTRNFSGSDIKTLVKEASMAVVRESIRCMNSGDRSGKALRKVTYNDMQQALERIRPCTTALYKIILGKASQENPGGLSQPSLNDDFDPNIISDDLEKSPAFSPSKNNQCQQAITLCAKTVLAHLVTHLGHFPMAIGAARLSSLVVEHDDVPNLPCDDLSMNIFSAPNIQLFIFSKNVIASLIELPALDLPGGGVTAGLSTADKQVRVLLRDLSGKSSWDASILYRTPETVKKEDPDQNRLENAPKTPSFSSIQPESLMVGLTLHTLPQRAMRHRPPNVLPDTSNAAPDLDQLDDLLQYLGHTSPECLESLSRKLNEPATPPMSIELEQEAIASVISQRNTEVEENRLMQHLDSMLGLPSTRPSSRAEANSPSLEPPSSQHSSLGMVEQSAFQQCRLLFSQLGLAGWERRQQLHLLNKTERLLRELRNLDNQSCRETHKFAVIYVAPGQEDKNSILSNQGGSVLYEQFLAALAWEIELEGHTGFLGGLQRQGTTGLTAPYIATSFVEAIFHVATRMPGDTPDAVLSKTRHLGNDEVHIVWSEHNRDYRRDIIPTEFCDILITIYPLGNNLNRVTVNCKADVPHFGVLFNEAIVESNILAGLVRATALCASRAKRITYQFYQQYYEERARSLDIVVTKHKHSTTYEDFISKVYSPVATPSPFCPSGSSSSGAGDGTTCNPSMLAAALLDSHGHSHKSSHRTDQKYRASANDASRGVWFNSPDMQNVESSISPRPLKRLSTNLKNSKKSLKHETSVESPPESPLQMTRRK